MIRHPAIKYVNGLLEVCGHRLPLSMQINYQSERTSVAHRVGLTSPIPYFPESINETGIDIEWIKKQMANLLYPTFNGRKKDIAVIELRYFHGLTLELTGKKLGLSRERVRQIEERAILRLQNAFNISLRRVCPEISTDIDAYYSSDKYRKKLRISKLDKSNNPC